ncbi:hypothetical protein O3M35_005203 [Rhynocoris fuscipes]|uniref:Lipocalin/cytosolic fatty-acid binding domain-containing protein n=1 Tax=Rhynocoris fuscipes TaxID=488301 RepID=A0AAW1DMN3_9HEMI
MVKFLIAVCLLAIINSSTSIPFIKSYFPWKLGNCLTNANINMKDFNATEFFNGSWYELMSYGNYLYQQDGRCPSFQAVLTTDGKKFRQLWYEYEPITQKWLYFNGITELNNLKGSQFLVYFDFLGGLTGIYVPATVVNTDYENYAVMYSCVGAFGFKLEMSIVFTRVRGDERNRQEIKESIENAGLNYLEYIQANQEGCGPNEPRI